jgi:hypothetical protein
MMTLFTRGVLGDNLAETLQAIKDRGGSEVTCEVGDDGLLDTSTCERAGGNVLLMWTFIIFMIISAFCLLNMIVGILCGVIEETAHQESETRNVDEAKMTLTQVFQDMDTSGDGVVTTVEWGKMVSNDKVRSSLMQIGLPEDALDAKLQQLGENVFKEGMDEENSIAHSNTLVVPGMTPVMPSMPTTLEEKKKDNGLDLDSFVKEVLANRADQDASRLDVEVLKSKVTQDEQSLNKQLGKIENMLFNLKRHKNGAHTQHYPKANGNSATAGEPKSGLPINLSASWLQGIPTAALFSALERRGARQKCFVAEVD